MRFWIAVLLIGLLVFQAVPATVSGKACVESGSTSGGASGENGGGNDNPDPGSGLDETYAPGGECHAPGPGFQWIAKSAAMAQVHGYAPLLTAAAADGHAQRETPPPERQ